MKQIFKDYKDILTICDIQKMLGIGRNSAYKLVKENRIKNIRIGTKYLIPKANLIDFLLTEQADKNMVSHTTVYHNGLVIEEREDCLQ